ncbi:MAG: hypothetical protein K0U68_06340 [Gammaproteobacteria bacterium]|nr:hypothetical protein [Gammaproteobacteria bacterium]
MVSVVKFPDYKSPLSCISHAPGIVFFMVAGLNGIERDEIKLYSQMIQSAEFEILRNITPERGYSLQTLLAEIQNDRIYPLEELKQLNFVIHTCLPTQLAQTYQSALINFAQGVAKISRQRSNLFDFKLKLDQKRAIETIRDQLKHV